jgi:hypothetical protein
MPSIDALMPMLDLGTLDPLALPRPLGTSS